VVKTKDAIEHFQTGDRRGRADLARALTLDGWKVTPEAISQWGEYPPFGRQCQIQLLTDGKLKADKPEEHDQKVA
tara:strand:- start:520 stop:744 length:225 start_codon:yes stop_codon:yes gene_type:complete